MNKETGPKDNPRELGIKINHLSKLKQLENEGVKVHTLVEILDPTKNKIIAGKSIKLH